MKVAILLCGNVRTWEKCKDSFDIFFKNIDYDIFVSTYDKQYDYHPYWTNQHPEFKDNMLDDIFIKNLFINNNKVKDIIITKDNDKFIEQERIKMNIKMKDYYHGFSQFNNIKPVLVSMEKYEEKNNFKYNIVIKTRFDILYNNILNYKINNNEILIDSNNTFPNDWFFIIERKNINNFINFLINEYYDLKYESSTLKPPHGVFENSCNDNKLKIMKINFNIKIIRNF
jgi:hypothetical protein